MYLRAQMVSTQPGPRLRWAGRTEADKSGPGRLERVGIREVGGRSTRDRRQEVRGGINKRAPGRLNGSLGTGFMSQGQVGFPAEMEKVADDASFPSLIVLFFPEVTPLH